MTFPARASAGGPALVVLLSLILSGPGCSPEAAKANHLRSADNLFASGELAQAEIEYLNVLKAEPQNPHAIGRLGLIYTEQGRLGQAVDYLTKGRRLDPGDLELRLKMGQLNVATGNLKEARDEANYILDHRPQDPEAPQLLVGTITKPAEIDAVRLRLQGLPPPAPGGAPVLVAFGLLELRQQHFTEAASLFQQAQAVDPKFAAAHSALGALHLARKEMPAADQSFRQAAELSPPRSPRRLQYAQYKIQTGDAAAGRQLLVEMTQKVPDYLPAWTTLADLAFAEKKYLESAGFVSKALARDPYNPQALLINGRLSLVQGDFDRAVTAFEKMAGIYPKLPAVYFELARSLAAAGKVSQAIDRLNQAVTLAPGYADAALMLASLSIRKGDLNGSVVLLKKLSQQRPDLAPARLLLADAYRAQGHPDDALAIYREVEEQFPQNPEAPYMRGLLLRQQNLLPEARAAFERAHQLTPASPVALEQLVNLDLLERKFPAARERVERELAGNPGLAGNCQLLFAKISLAQDDTAQAEVALNRAIEIMPDSSTAYFLLAGIYTTTNQRQKALASLEKALARNPKDTTALMLIGVIHDQQKEYPAAREAYEKILAINPRFIGALNNLAYLYAGPLHQVEKAYELAQRARELQPDDPHIADTLGWILYRKGQYPRALFLLEESIDKLAGTPEIQFHLGMTHYMMGEEESARLALQRAVQSGTEFDGLDQARKSLAVLETDAAHASPEARAALEAAAAERTDDPVVLARLATVYEHAGNIDRAISSLESALQVNASNVAVLLRLAALHAGKHDAVKAISFAKVARKLAPGDPEVAHALGRLAYEVGDYPWATSLLQEAARKLPDAPDLLFDLAEAAYSIGQVADAAAAANHALQVGGPFRRADEARNFAGLITAAAIPEQAAKQSGLAEQLLRSDPAYVPALMVLGTIAEQKPDSEAAGRIYEKVLNRFPDFSPAKRRLAILGAARPDFEQKTYDLAIQARTAIPGDAELAKALGILNYRKGDYSRAVSLLKESALTRANDAEIWFFLGMSQNRLKTKTESRQSLQQALDLGLRSDLAVEARKILSEG